MFLHAPGYLALVLVTLVCFYLAPARFQWLILTLASSALLLYFGWLGWLLPVLLAAFNYGTGLLLERYGETDGAKARVVLFGTLAVNIAALAAFKYAEGWIRATFFSSNSSVAHALLPLGISYYSFQLIGYALEVYWGREQAERRFGRFLESILFFPKLFAGPIERTHRFLEQARPAIRFDGARIVSGIERIGYGVFKKAVIADRLGVLVDPVYRRDLHVTGLPVVIAIGLYTLQVYNDFSAVTDIALGVARLFGIDLTENFDAPFSAKSLTEFWRRWHMSLSSWTSDYVYRPFSHWLAMQFPSRRGSVTIPIVASFVILGVWHGANWTFVSFGLLHGLAVAFEVTTQQWRTRMAARFPGRLVRAAGNARTLLFYALSCVFFRADSVSTALDVFRRAAIRHSTFTTLLNQKLDIVILLCTLALWLTGRIITRSCRQEWALGARAVSWFLVTSSIVVVGMLDTPQFVYMQF